MAHLYDNNGAPASFHELSFEEYHTNSWLGHHGDAVYHSTASRPHGCTDNTSHACIIVAPTFTPQAPNQIPASSTIHKASFSTAGVPITPQLHGHGHGHGHSHHLASHQTSAPRANDIKQGPATLAHPHQASTGNSLPPDPNHPLECCNYIFRNDQTLKRHRREVKSCPHYVPGTAPVYTCHWCYRSFKRRSTLDQHLVETCQRTAGEARQDLAAWYPR